MEEGGHAILVGVAAGTLEAQPPRGCPSTGGGAHQQGRHCFLSSQNPESPVGFQLLKVGSTEKKNYACKKQGSDLTHATTGEDSAPQSRPAFPGPRGNRSIPGRLEL